MLKTLLALQKLDLQIETCKRRELEIPKQKNKFKLLRERLESEVKEQEEVCQKYVLEQRENEGEIEQKQAQAGQYEQQLNLIKKNEEYQALLHEIDLLKKQVSIKEERIITAMVELDDARARLKEDEKRIEEEVRKLDAECADIDRELEEAVKHRGGLEEQRRPLLGQIDKELIRNYSRLRLNMKSGPVVVPMNGEVCGGCHMYLRAQIVNEILAGKKMHQCTQCGRILYHPDNYQDESVGAQ